MKKRFALAFFAVLLLAVLSGCGTANDTKIIRVAFNQSETHAEYADEGQVISKNFFRKGCQLPHKFGLIVGSKI